MENKYQNQPYSGLDEFALIFDNLHADVGVYEIFYNDKGIPEDLIIRYMNPVARRRIKNNQYYIGRNFSDTHETSKHILKYVKEVLKTGKSKKYEIYVPKLDQHFSINAFSPKKDIYVTITEDITQQKKVEDTFTWNQRRGELLADINSRLLSENPQDIIDELCQATMEFLKCDVFFNYMVDKEKDCLYLNSYAGIPQEEAEKIEWLDYGAAVCGCAALESKRIIAEDIFHNPDPCTDLVRSYGVQAYACHPLLIEGESIGTLSFGTKSRINFSNKELEVMKAVTDQISIAMDRLISNQILMDSESKYRELVENANSIILKYDREGKITFFNEYAQKFFGYDLDEVLKKHVKILLPENEEIHEHLEQDILNYPEKFKEYVNKNRLQNGEIVWVSWTNRLIEDENGNIIGNLAIGQDVTQRKIAEIRMEKMVNELKRSNYELQQFAYITSHDLQEPLRNIASFAQLLERRYKGQIDPDADDFINYMVSGCSRMKEMIQGVHEYSRIEKEGKFENIDTDEVLKRVLMDQEDVVKGINAIITYDNLPNIKADDSQLYKLFFNLISNALKFINPDKTPEIHISAEKYGKNKYLFSVADNGIGIKKEFSHKIFEVFKTLNGIDKYEGIGMGLSISKRIVEKYGGQIWVESVEGKGSTFYFTLPKTGI